MTVKGYIGRASKDALRPSPPNDPMTQCIFLLPNMQIKMNEYIGKQIITYEAPKIRCGLEGGGGWLGSNSNLYLTLATSVLQTPKKISTYTVL